MANLEQLILALDKKLLDLNKGKLKERGRLTYKKYLQGKYEGQIQETIIRETQDYLETFDNDLEIKRVAMNNISWRDEEANTNVDELGSAKNLL